ncbi:P-loop containing nucleoside triphosphate hydrolase protein [Mycena vitilis]|nr:P-loop containing nucleoside triphosphate hydrolase protein [Mycena vitilis]
MPFTPVDVLDPERLKLTAQTLCDVFGLPSLYPHQVNTGQNILKGITTLLDVPTGGGKTIAFWYALFYHWQPGRMDDDSKKIVLVIGPLVALLQSQARTLNEKGIPAVSITGASTNLKESLIALGQNKFRVGFVGPEMALSTLFHEHVLNQISFTQNIICLVIDELHCICEWGTDDFRPEYAQIVKLMARLPTSLPVLGATATAPRDVIQAILDNLGLPKDSARIQVSNRKPNISLAVRILQQEPESFADLLLLFSEDVEGPEDFPQTLLYANERQHVEKIQDFLRDNSPPCIDGKTAFEFYHRHIDEARKESIYERIQSGELRGVSATDALGLGIDFRTIMRVFLWMKPRTFLSLVQKLGRCVRDLTQRGEGVLFITKAMYTRCCAELEMMRAEQEAAEERPATSEDENNEGEPADRDAALDSSDDEEEGPPVPVKRRHKGKGKRKALSPAEWRDMLFLLEYITTEKCRKVVWDEFFGNRYKDHLAHPGPEAPCCDNCHPELFEVETIALVGGPQLKGGRKKTSSPELEAAVRTKLDKVRDKLAAAKYPNNHFLTGNAIMADDVLDVLAKRARLVTSIDTLQQQVRWVHASTYGAQIVDAIQAVVVNFPDPAKAAREAEATQKQQKILDAAAFRELRSRLIQVFDGCYNAVYSEEEPVPEATGRKRKNPRKPRRICQLFLRLPRADFFPDYQVLIKEPISMSMISKLSKKATHYTSLAEYRAAWHLMFDNARQYNRDGSEVFEDANRLQKVFDRSLYMLSHLHNIPGREHLPEDMPSRASSPTPPPVDQLLPHVN